MQVISIDSREDLDGVHVLVFADEEETFYLEKPGDGLMSVESYTSKTNAMQALLRSQVTWTEIDGV